MAELATLENHTGVGKAVSQQEQTPEAPPPEAPKGPKRYEFVQGGGEGLISLDSETRSVIVQRLVERKDVIDALASEGRPLSDIDKILYKSGKEIAERIRGEKTFTRDDLAFARYVLENELWEKSFAVGKVARLTEIETIRKKLLRGETKTVVPSLTVEEVPIKKFSTEHTKKIGFDALKPEEVDIELADLRILIHDLDAQLTGKSLIDPVEDLDAFFSDFAKKTGYKVLDERVDRLNEILSTRYNGKDYVTLLSENPYSAIQAFHEANGRTITSFARELAKDYLKGEKPSVDTAVITSQAEKLRGEPKPEEVDPPTNEQIKITQAKLDAVNKELDEVNKEIGELQTSEDYKTDELSEDANKRLAFLDSRKNEVLKNQLLTKADLDSFRLKFREAVDKALEKYNAPEARLERQEKAKGLEKWTMVARPENYKQIINARFSQTFEDPFTLERLASTREIVVDGEAQLEGAERIRQHIFWLIDKQGFDPKLARKMLSDETIGKAIIWIYKLDATKITDLKATLPYLKSSQFQAGDLMRFLIHEGLRSAEQGNSYLTLSEYYAKPKPELALEVESIYSEGIGEIVKMKDNQVFWEGTVANALDPIDFSRTVPQHYSVGLGIARNVVNYSLFAKTDREFLELLPDVFDPSLPDYVRVFYDDTGKLSMDKPDIPRWLEFYHGGRPTTEDTLASLNGMISADFSQLITSSVADHFLKRSTSERLQMLRGFGTVKNISNVALAENPAELHNYRIRLDNSGNFFIQDVTDPASPKEEQELSSFFQKRLEDFKGSKLTLSQDERNTLRDEFLKILSPLGREILRAQQRR